MPTTPTILSAAVEAQARRYMTAGLVPLSLNMETFVAKLYELCEEQQQRLDRQRPPHPDPVAFGRRRRLSRRANRPRYRMGGCPDRPRRDRSVSHAQN